MYCVNITTVILLYHYNYFCFGIQALIMMLIDIAGGDNYRSIKFLKRSTWDGNRKLKVNSSKTLQTLMEQVEENQIDWLIKNLSTLVRLMVES